MLVRAGIAQLNSEWTDNFSTEARATVRERFDGERFAAELAALFREVLR